MLARWDQQVTAGLLAVCPLVELEFLYTARSVADRKRLAEQLRAAFGWVVMPDRIYERAAEIQGELTARGAALRDRIEETTDRLAARSPVLPEDPSRVIRVLRVLSADIRRHPSFPDATPIGVPHPMAKG